MKKSIILFLCALSLLGCNNSVVEKPDNLIDKDEMVDIIYDLSLLEGIRSSNYNSLKERGINPAKYVYKKYNIDSLQFAKSDRYYASDIEVYAKIYEKVTARLENEKKLVDSLAKVNPDPIKKMKPKKDSTRLTYFRSTCYLEENATSPTGNLNVKGLSLAWQNIADTGITLGVYSGGDAYSSFQPSLTIGGNLYGNVQVITPNENSKTSSGITNLYIAKGQGVIAFEEYPSGLLWIKQ